MPVPDAPAVTFPDAELIVTGYLRGQLSGVTVCTILPADFGPPIVRVRRLGGARHRRILDAPRMDVDCWAASPAAVNDLIGQVRSALGASRGYAASGGLITSSEELAGPSWRPEDRSDLHRRGLTHQLMIRPVY